MVDWNAPSNSTLYTNVLSNLNDKHLSLAKQDYGSDTNIPTGAIRFNSTTKLYERWSGSVWAMRPGEENIFPSVITTTGTQPTYVATPTVPWTSYVAGDTLYLNIHSANTGSSTVNVSGLGAITIKWMGQNLVGGELNGKHLLVYDGTNFNLQNHGGGWATWTPSWPTFNSQTFGSVVVSAAIYQRHGSRVDFLVEATGTAAGTPSYGVAMAPPVATGFGQGAFGAFVADGGSSKGGLTLWAAGNIVICKYNVANITAGTVQVSASGSYRV